ncbi:hypothetical protein K503DRAFT_294981 [Rhizopogon vinicolor AM-OR11-026]|uniref:Uncharacterized protein n=1 Tax=Rhizopogon vinicolor AM-OR11-026 TaxID=1314800 RepID=A0A1B7MVD7_9AGAM|nr:hypothetical protein K503DRAFT_294981 [Rhizopogon vinicolor AM-OR11-026]
MLRRRAEWDDSQATESFSECGQQTHVLKIRGTQVATMSLPRRERRPLRSASAMYAEFISMSPKFKFYARRSQSLDNVVRQVG